MRMERIIALAQALRGAARIVVVLAVFDYLTVEQITRLLFSHASLSYVRKLLKYLEAQLLVQPLPRQTDSQPRLFTLTGKGYRYAAALGMETGKRVRTSEEQGKGRNEVFALHTIAVIDVLISAWLLSRSVPGIVLHQVYRERDLQRQIYVQLPVPIRDGKTELRTICLEPDCSVQFFLNNKWQEFIHFEVYRTHLAEWRFKQKIRSYAAYAGSSLHRELFHTRALSIAVITQSAVLADRLKRWTEDVLQDRRQRNLGEQFFFTNVNPATASPEELFLSPVWEQAFGHAKTPLILLDEK
jgi:Replication-relaxation